ncbi:hypothetical protein VPNG_01020 [Cytospora leucostoma]|uniref:Mid2 domain-containing protein n=1 Tax=Cytospora leucostoma TaxID=1230097 RepID=A0A423XKT0_9PEZI|nr:hypothetical protein VPNG_01020 [Cytospora leucostoma]
MLHSSVAFAALFSLVMSQSLVLEAQDGTCGYLNGVKRSSYGCQATSQKCAVYYPTSSLAGNTGTDISVASMNPTTLSVKRRAPRATQTGTAAITPAPEVDYPAVVCCDPSKGACTAQPTACVDAFEHPYSALCTGNCPNDPMTLKCTAGPALHCNQIEFESPLYYKRNTGPNEVFSALEAMGVAAGPGRGWFCGASALPTKLVQTTIISRRPVFGDASSSPTPSASLSSIQFGAPASAVPGMIPGALPGPQSGYNPGAVDNGLVPSDDYNYAPDAAFGEGCCVDEAGTSDECCADIVARREQRQETQNVVVTSLTTIVTSPSQLRLATTTATPAAGPKLVITEGFAVVSTTYGGQSDRSPFSEASRSWDIMVPSPTLNATTTSKSGTSHHGPGLPTMKPKDDHEGVAVGRIVGAAIGGAVGLGLVIFIAIKCNKRRKADPRRLSGNKGKKADNRKSGSGASQSRLSLWHKYLRDTAGHLSWASDRSSKTRPPTIPPDYFGPNLKDLLRGGSSPRGRDTRPRSPPRAKQVSPSPRDSAGDEDDSKSSSSPTSGPYFNATPTPKKNKTSQIQPLVPSLPKYL